MPVIRAIGPTSLPLLQIGFNLFSFTPIDSETSPSVATALFENKSLFNEYGERFFNHRDLLADSLLQQPPLGNSFDCIVGVRMIGQIGQNINEGPGYYIGMAKIIHSVILSFFCLSNFVPRVSMIKGISGSFLQTVIDCGFGAFSHFLAEMFFLFLGREPFALVGYFYPIRLGCFLYVVSCLLSVVKKV